MKETEEEPLAAEKARSGRRKLVIAIIVVVILLLAIFVPPLVNLGHYSRSITTSMANALGRPVAVGSMQLRLLPTPGITMSDFTLAEDPAFGYEPVLHANSVVASVRLSSLWRGRLEVSQISLDEASLNLIRNESGAWNIGSVLTRASQVPNAPTGNRFAGPQPRFPYIEADDARINFKDGVEKRPFSLTNAQFAMWQASGNEWHIRLKAQPVRTDLQMHTSDTGVVTLEGSLRRASDLHTMPVDLRATWSGAQLGQVTQMLAGVDSGWRGDLDLTVRAIGTPDNLSLISQLQIGDLRRQEFEPANPVSLSANCRTFYLHPRTAFEDITCFLPEGSGHLLITGAAQGFLHPKLNLQVALNQVPAALPVSLIALLRPSAGSISATGAVNGSFHLITGDAGAGTDSLTGDATAAGVKIGYPGGTIVLPNVRFVARSTEPVKRKRKGRTVALSGGQPLRLALDPFAIPLGEPQPLNIDGQFSQAGFTIDLNGPAAISRVLAAGHALGFPRSWFTADKAGTGRADLNTTISGGWITPVTGSGPGITAAGTVRVSGLQLSANFLRAPLEVTSADINLSSDQIAWQNALFHYAGLDLRGSVAFPANCNQSAPCPASFSLDAPELNGAEIEGALHRTPSGFIGQMLSNLSSGNPPEWPPMQGVVHAGALTLGRLVLHKATATLSIGGSGMQIQSCDADALGGTVQASGSMSLSNGEPQWDLAVRFTGVQASDTGALFLENWGPGSGNGTIRLKMSGYRAAELAASASGDFRFTWQNGGLSDLSPETPLAHFVRWSGAGTIAHSTIALASGGIAGPHSGIANAIDGTIGFDRSVNLTIHGKAGVQHIRGTLNQPQSAP